MTALIVSFPTDTHAVVAQWGLIQKGVACDLLSYADVPARSFATYDPAADRHSFRAPQMAQGGADYRVVWNRRALFGARPDFVHPADWPQVQRDQRRLHDDFALVGAPNATWVNAPEAQRRGQSKAYQLRLAAQIGLEIPPTLISNDPEAVRAFVARTGDCIAKPLGPMSWQGGGRQVDMMTAGVSLADLAEDDAIRACRMIYQARIDKAVEYRVTVFGSEVVCVALDSQAVPGAELDWRDAATKSLGLTEVACPDGLKDQLLRFMRASGLLFGAFDLARTPDGRFVFFEVNEQGQFLWLEAANPEIRLLDRMVQFLRDPREDFVWRRDGASLTLAEAETSDHVVSALEAAQHRHAAIDWNVTVQE